jgi:hypothetical protein
MNVGAGAHRAARVRKLIKLFFKAFGRHGRSTRSGVHHHLLVKGVNERVIRNAGVPVERLRFFRGHSVTVHSVHLEHPLGLFHFHFDFLQRLAAEPRAFF